MQLSLLCIVLFLLGLALLYGASTSSFCCALFSLPSLPIPHTSLTHYCRRERRRAAPLSFCLSALPDILLLSETALLLHFIG